jgi:hypothetical protein
MQRHGLDRFGWVAWARHSVMVARVAKSALLVVHSLSVVDSGFAPMTDSASLVGLEALDELRIRLLACQLALEAIEDEVDLNFDETFAGLASLQQLARQAFGAVSILSQGAVLDASWSTGPSRPKAVFARHSAAVQEGASRVTPEPSLIEIIEERLRELPPSDISQKYRGPRPRCTAVVAKNDQPCTNTAIYLGAGSCAEHCYSHCTPAERDAYRQHHEGQNFALEEAGVQRSELLRRLGRVIIEDWHQGRELERPWLNVLAEV